MTRSISNPITATPTRHHWNRRWGKEQVGAARRTPSHQSFGDSEHGSRSPTEHQRLRETSGLIISAVVGVPEALSQIALSIKIDNENAIPVGGQQARHIRSEGGLQDPAFAVDRCDYALKCPLVRPTRLATLGLQDDARQVAGLSEILCNCVGVTSAAVGCGMETIAHEQRHSEACPL